MKRLTVLAAVLTASVACSQDANTESAEVAEDPASALAPDEASDALAAQAARLLEILAESPRVSANGSPINVELPEGWELGMVSWVAAADDGLIYLLQRGEGADPVIALDRDGRVVRSWGRGMYETPHAIRVDPDGNVWTADAKSSRVFKFATDGTLMMEIAVGGQPEDCTGNFCGTSDVGFGPNGDVFIADGYRNARILRYTADGRKVGEWGSAGTGPGELNLPHSIDVDDEGIVYVADRENGRIQRFDREGTFLGEWPDYGKTFSLTVAPDGVWLGTQQRNEPNVSPGWLIRVDPSTGNVLGYVDATGIHGMDAAGGELFYAPGPEGNPGHFRLPT